MSEQQRSPKPRPYAMARRAEQVGETRQRIVDAAVHLHGTVGPAGTSIAAIAERAGVTRLTVYRHFPDDTALFTACSQDWLSRHALPEPEAWERIPDPVERLRAGLADLYRFYRSGAQMLAMIHRDRDVVPAPVREFREAADRARVDVLASAFADRDRRDRRLRLALTAHAAAFPTWRSLCVEQGLTDKEAVAAMVALVRDLPDR
ncbi:TetR/AcrR family transcriptional regulator [Yinghuangia seranimata]|uniref:TetR/AcrR family transcriptional regulator n=1 Tax=Yinghuangia seranimata TaxID=408067 RepID=UPI00248C7472|nr:TetR family transcriptional regulator [Yinghuangia seranimata]MDI2125620.1 TetR family transcriptional regulator [Yinghuangia seranimata]